MERYTVHAIRLGNEREGIPMVSRRRGGNVEYAAATASKLISAVLLVAFDIDQREYKLCTYT